MGPAKAASRQQKRCDASRECDNNDVRLRERNCINARTYGGYKKDRNEAHCLSGARDRRKTTSGSVDLDQEPFVKCFDLTVIINKILVSERRFLTKA